ncbi:MAG: hypothetical protein ACP6IP_06760 [Candidatus Njordarchaeia archaeon]
MSSKRRKRFSLFDDIFEDFFSDFDDLFGNIGGMTGGYSISVMQTPEGTVVQATIGDDVDPEEFRKQLEQRYPGAKIIIRGGKSIKKIERVSEEKEEEKKVTITLEDEGEKIESKEAGSEPSILDLMSGGRKKPFIKREED